MRHEKDSSCKMIPTPGDFELLFILLGGAVLCFTIVVFFGGDSFL